MRRLLLRHYLFAVLCSFSTLLVGCASKNIDERVEKIEAQMVHQQVLEMRINHAEERLEILEQRVGGGYPIAKPNTQPKYAPPTGPHSVGSAKQVPVISAPVSTSPKNMQMGPVNTLSNAQSVSTLGGQNGGLSATNPSLSFSTPPLSASAETQSVPVTTKVSNKPVATPQKKSAIKEALASIEETQQSRGVQQNPLVFDPNRPAIPAGARIVYPKTSPASGLAPAKRRDIEAKSVQNPVQKNVTPILESGLAQYKTGQAGYDTALATYEKGQYAQAYTLFEAFGKENPTSKLLPNVFYWQGECQYSLKQYARSILLFKDVVSKYPKHAKSADALLKLGLAYKEIADAENSRFYWEILVEDYPQTRAAKLARQYLASHS